MKENRAFAFMKKYRMILTVAYTTVYLWWFSFLEKHITTNYHVMHCRLDDLIPFNEWFIFAYMFWFIYIAVTMIYMVLDADEYVRYTMFLATGMSLSLLICQLFPNGTAPGFRPAVDAAKNWPSSIVAFIYRTDTCTNVFPSIHVFNAIGTHIAINRSRHFADRPGIRKFSLVAAILICVSTMFVKQHSLIDVTGGCILSYFVYHLVYGKIPVPQVAAKKREKKKVWA